MSTDQGQKSSFLSVMNTWPSYFNNMDEGLGTTYERFILHRYFKQIKEDYKVNTLLEVPSFGMTGVSGINSLWWAQNGVRPTVVDSDQVRIDKALEVWRSIPLEAGFVRCKDFSTLPFETGEFDMSWNFASLWFVADLTAFLSELARVTRKVIFICVPNRNGIGYRLRDWMNRDDLDGMYRDNIRPGRFIKELKVLNWQLHKSGYLDIPPWPDIAMKKEDMLNAVGLGFLTKPERQKIDARQTGRTCIVDYFNGSNPQLEKNILRYSFLEKAPFPVKQLWGHHRYFIFGRV